MDLTDNQQEALLNFQAITECYDLSEAIECLATNSWDPTVLCTQAAASAYFAHSQQSVSPLIDTDPWEDMVETPGDRLATAYTALTTKLQGFWNRFGTFYTVPSSIRGDPSAQRPRISTILSKRLPQGCRLPNFQSAPLEDYEKLSRSNRKPLLIWFYTSQISQEYLTETLCSEVVVDILDTNFLLWGLDEKAPTFEPLKRQLRLQTVPAFVSGRSAAQRRIEYIESLVQITQVGETTLETLASYLERVILRFDELERPKDPRLEEARRIRAEQDRALREAELEAEHREKTARAERVAQQRAEEEQKEKSRALAQMKEQLKQSIGPEPPESPEACTVLLRLPSGDKIQRRFWKRDTVKVSPRQKLHDYVKSLDVPLSAFEVVTGFPAHPLSDESQTLEAAGLHPHGVLHIRDAS